MSNTQTKKLICVVGPTAVGKTKVAIEIAKFFKTEILSCDSRQLYREMKIGTAVPSDEELLAVKHYFIGQLSIHDYYSVFRYEVDALNSLKSIFQHSDYAVLTGGSGLYMNAVIKGIDDIPDPDPVLRASLIARLETEGLESLRFDLKRLDPEYYKEMDTNNPKRILRGLEVFLTTGQKFSSFRTGKKNPRFFDPIFIVLERDRTELHQRINNRVDQMMEDGLENEARELYPNKQLNALNTVGYKELFTSFDGEYGMDQAVELIKRNTRRYARRQISWNQRYKPALKFHPDNISDMIDSIRNQLSSYE